MLRAHRDEQQKACAEVGREWSVDGLVFATATGMPLDSANVRRGFRSIARHAGLDAERWTPRELRHSFVSLLSDSGTPIEVIADLVGHAGTRATEAVYRHQLRPVLLGGQSPSTRCSASTTSASPSPHD